MHRGYNCNCAGPSAPSTARSYAGRIARTAAGRPAARAPAAARPADRSAPRAVVGADRDADSVVDQVAEQAVQGGLAVEPVEDQPHRRLDLLVGVDRPLAGGQPDVADRGHAEEVAAAGLVELALVHSF